MKQAEPVRCIYCKEVGEASKEHVLQRSLGGNLTTGLICKTCNTSFSTIDQSLAENSMLALTRVAVTEKSMPVQLGGDHFWRDSSGIWNDLKIANQLQAVVLPQIHLKPVGEQLWIDLAGGEHEAIERFLAVVDGKVADESLLSVHVRVGPLDKCPPPSARLVGYRRDQVYLRASSEEAGRKLLKMLKRKWQAFRAQQSRSPPQPTQQLAKPSVQISMSIRPDDNYRAIAKIPFNLLAANMGAGFMLQEEFDLIRNYIRGIGLVHKDPLPDDEVAVDTRFVQPLVPGEGPLIPTGSHAVVIAYAAPLLGALVTLYERTSFVVHLAEIVLSEHVLVAHEFSIDRSVNRTLEISELVKRLWASSRT